MLTISAFSLDFQRLTDQARTHFCATAAPVFSWILNGSEPGDGQASFRLAFRCPGTRFRFHTPEIASAEQRYRYDGPALPAGQRIEVELEATARKSGTARISSWFFLADAGEWRAPWIASALDLPLDRPRYFRRPFRIRRRLRRAELYACGLGYQRVCLDGKALEGNRPLDPPFTDYSRRCQYILYPDLHEFLETGKHCLGVMVGLGWRDNACVSSTNFKNDHDDYSRVPFRGEPCLTAALHLVYERGGEEWLFTDGTWECGAGALVGADVFNGCTYDARLENPAWCTAGFAGYVPAKLHPGPGGKMEPMVLSPVCEAPAVAPVAQWQKDGKWFYDFGVNLAGVLSVTLPRGLREGQRVILRHSEELTAGGDLFTAPLRSARATDTYIACGGECGGTAFVPSFTYHGFRYASVECPQGVMLEEPPLAIPLRNPLDKDSGFRCGDPMANAVADACLQTERSNLHSLLTDCPQRNERMGWMNDATVRFESFPYAFEANQIFRKVTRDLMDEQSAEGGITCTAPYIWGYRPADPVSSSFLIAGWQNYLFDGDDTILREAYPAYQAWVRCLRAHRDADGTVNYSHWGDWAAPAYACKSQEDPHSAVTPPLLVSTGFLYYDCKLLARMAAVLGRRADVRRYEAEAQETAEAILAKWYDPAAKTFGGGSQGSQALMLWLGLFPEDAAQTAADALARELRESGYRFTTGNLCTRYLCEMLIRHGHEDDAWAILTKQDYPSFGYMFQQEATTIWERYEQKANGGMNSHNHPMYGAISYVLYACLAGIRPRIAERRVDIEPHFPARLQSLQAKVETAMGAVAVHWFRRYGVLNLHVTVPFGLVAEVSFDGKTTACPAGFHTFARQEEE